MKLLLVGDANSPHIHNYIKDTLAPLKIDVVIFNISSAPVSEKSQEVFEQYNISCTGYFDKVSKAVMKVPKVRALHIMSTAQSCLSNMGEFDICQVHFLSEFACDLVYKNRDKYKRIIVNYWGSDLLRSDEKTRASQRKLIAVSSDVIMQTAEMKKYFSENISPDSIDKVRTIKFVCSSIDYVAQIKKDCPTSCGESIKIACGYNATEAQQHIQILEALSKLSDEQKRKIEILLLMTYGEHSADYIDRVCKCAKDSGLKYSAFTSYLSREEMTKINCSADIYINALKTDAFSASMQEFLSAGAVMICGRWLGYSDIKSNGGFFYCFDEFEELPSILNTLTDNLSQAKEDCLINRNVLYSLSSAEAINRQYRKLLLGS